MLLLATLWYPIDFLNNTHQIVGVVRFIQEKGHMFKIWQPNVLTATIVQGPDNVISKGRQMTNSMLNFEYLLLLCFLTATKF